MRSGILLVDKPVGMSSAAVVAKVKRRFGFKKIGHGGTLDPFASGLLVLLIGEGTKIARFLLEGDKTYEAEATLGFETTTGDLTGEPLEEKSDAFSREPFETTLKRFIGTISQRPPMYSAIKRDGEPLYAYARRGEHIEVAERNIVIHSLEILGLEEKKLRFRVTCGGGTYIRVLAQDWARAAGTRAHLSALRRTHSHSFSLADAHNLTTLLDSPDAPSLISIGTALAHLPRVNCDNELARLLRNGNPKALEQIKAQWPEMEPLALATEKSSVIAILSRDAHQNSPVIERVFDPQSGEA